MNNKTWIRRFLAFCLIVVVATAYSTVTAQTRQTGELVSSGEVTINGQSAASGATVFSDSTIVTGTNSSATIRLGSLGQVELSSNSNLKLSFTETGLSGTLASGQVRVSNTAGISAVISTKDGSATGDSGQANTFTVSIDDCGVTRVATQLGAVLLRENGKERRIEAGKDASIGKPAPGTRCSAVPPTVATAAIGTLGTLALLLIPSAAIASVLIINAVNDEPSGGQVVSPMR